MAFFRKKEPREIKEDDPLFIKLWYNKRSHAAIILGLYFIFFLVIILIARFNSTKPLPKEEVNTVKGSSISEIFSSLDEKSISYNYVIKFENKTYYFSGDNSSEDISGTLLFNGDSSTIKLIDNECVVGEYTKKGFVKSNSLCPENINYEYFDYDNIYELISDLDGTINEEEKYYLFDKDGYNFMVYYNENNVLTKIIIKNNINISYELTYSVSDDSLEE